MGDAIIELEFNCIAIRASDIDQHMLKIEEGHLKALFHVTKKHFDFITSGVGGAGLSKNNQK